MIRIEEFFDYRKYVLGGYSYSSCLHIGYFNGST